MKPNNGYSYALTGSFISGDDGEKWIVPFSWMTVYGPPPDMSMF